MTEFWLAELAQKFWQTAGEEFKGDLETAIVMSLPIVTAPINKLTVYNAYDWLNQKGINLTGLESVRDRPLRACLVAYGNARNFILWDATDTPAEQLYSLAHEVGHYLLDFELPRQKAIRHLGPKVLEVYDGLRQPSTEERLHGLIAGVRVQPQHHFMERDKHSEILSSQILEIENRADKLALELLAPEEEALPVIQKVTKGKVLYSERLEIAEEILIDQFGLTPAVAKAYVVHLLNMGGVKKSFQEWLNF